MKNKLMKVAWWVLACSVAGPTVVMAQLDGASERKALLAERRASAMEALAAARAGPARGVKTVRVDCDQGERIMSALAKHAGALVVEVRGICPEDVTIERSDVTLRGLDPAVDGIRGQSAEPARRGGLTLSHASRIVLENISVSDGPAHGVFAEYSSLTMVNCRTERNALCGVHISAASFLVAEAIVASANLTRGIHSELGAFGSCAGCTLEGNVQAALANEGGMLTLGNSVVSGPRGIWAQDAGSYVDVDCINFGSTQPCSVTSTGYAAQALNGGYAALFGPAFTGVLRATRGGRIDVVGARQQPLPGNKANSIGEFSVILTEAWDTYFPAISRTSLWGFSHALLYQTELLARLTCDGGSDAMSDLAYPASMVSTCKSVPVTP